ncbi:hypothetical protein DNHGIG_00410 [Collibacillus ludicampi]|jgi:hypothetical protein|uniref:Uncharacterized protein n=1 Tax=Collibacillus ludicampi TaxID=2771369 RepID=A0AAV4L9M2_9BACL|nr:hypothetical protein [Collibacillus ludicampi]GIM44492.1 hypothetical protein DNHGIG_00410 [Collibacillus ludicampi]
MSDIINVIGKDIDPERDIFLGETSVQITGFWDYPSVHIVRSYQVRDTEDAGESAGGFYHIFHHKCGTTVVNYNRAQYEQVAKFIDVSDHWQIFYYNEEHGFWPVSKDWRYTG